MDDISPTARALLCLEVVQDRPGITAEQLAERLGVSDRAARRYVAILREAGLPIESVRGPYGGYRVGRGLRVPPLLFTTTEALGLVMAVLDGHHDAADGTDPVGSALGKLLRALPAPIASQAEAVRRTAAPAPDRGAARPDPETATTLVQACADHHRIGIGYRSEAGTELRVDVDPWAVVIRHGRWYLLCWSHRAEATRTYRVDRISDIVFHEAVFTPPADLDPVADLEANLGFGWEYDIEVLFKAPIDRVSPCLSRTLGKLEPIDDHTCRLVGSTSNPVWYAEQLAAVPAAYKIIECPELRECARVIGQRLIDAG